MWTCTNAASAVTAWLGHYRGDSSPHRLLAAAAAAADTYSELRLLCHLNHRVSQFDGDVPAPPRCALSAKLVRFSV